MNVCIRGCNCCQTGGIELSDFFQNAYLLVMSTETLATTKVKIAKMYALVRRNLNDIPGN